MTEIPSLLYSEVEDDLRGVVRDLFTERSSWSDVLARTEDPDTAGNATLWKGLTTELGCAGLPVAEEAGGAGGSWLEVSVVMEEIGRAVADVPYYTSSVVATALLEAVGATDLLAELAAGTKVAAVVTPLTATPSVWNKTGLTRSAGKVTGTVRLVAGVENADVLLAIIGDAVLAIDATAALIDPRPSLDMTRRLADVTLNDVTAAVLAEGEGTAEAVETAGQIASAMLASEQLGLAERVLQMTVEYLKERRQFGRVLGSYQALKHRLADLWTELTQARAVARYAAACAATGSEDLAVAASLAQEVCGRIAQKAAEECVQLHGGIGFTWEFPAHLYLKRARADALAFGSPSWHRSRVGELVGLARP